MTHQFRGTEEPSPPLLIPFQSSLWLKFAHSDDLPLRSLDFGLVRAVSHRLCQQSVPGQSQEGPRRRESERGAGRQAGGGGSRRDPPRGGAAAWILQTRVRVRVRSGLEEHKGSGGRLRLRGWLRQPRIINCVSASPAPPRPRRERGHADPLLRSSAAVLAGTSTVNIHV